MAEQWELTILDADPPTNDLGSLAVGDVDGDGHIEVITGGIVGLLWYRPATLEKGVVCASADCHVGLAVHDIDGDGLDEVIVGHRRGEGENWSISWFKPGKDMSQPWEQFTIDLEAAGGPHDVVCVDIDGDGEVEIIVNACDGPKPGLYAYKRTADITKPWKRHPIHQGHFAEGTTPADVDGDGRLEIVFGPHLYRPPAAGALSGLWSHELIAPSFREMNRTAVVDITGTGRPDVVIVESEFYDGRLAWLENRTLESPETPWIQHVIDTPLVYAHSLQARRDAAGTVRLFVAEMAEGGWSAPWNHDARLMEYCTKDAGATWQCDILHRGSGTHEAVRCDIDGDGQMEIVGKEWRRARQSPKVHIFKKPDRPSPLEQFSHRLLDLDKPDQSIDIVAADVNGDGRDDVVCGSWWYRNGDWERFLIADDFEVITAADVTGDGRAELIGIKRTARGYAGLTAELVWMRAVDPEAGKWERHAIGTGTGDWPHGALVASVLPDGRKALIVGYHSATKSPEHCPELFEIPDDPTKPWPRRQLADIPYGEEFAAVDINGNGLVDIVAGPWWLENVGDGTFRPHRIAPEGLKVARVGIADLTGNGLPDVILGEEKLDFKNRHTPMSRLVWLANPGKVQDGPWAMHVIDKLRCPHSIGVADFDGDGELEIACGEHDPFPGKYRSRCRMIVYKKADPAGLSWKQHVLDNRFEHHDGAKVIETRPGRFGILSHGWKDARYVHLWEAPAADRS